MCFALQMLTIIQIVSRTSLVDDKVRNKKKMIVFFSGLSRIGLFFVIQKLRFMIVLSFVSR